MNDRRLSETEVARLMSRIAARQTETGAPDGVTLAQLKQAVSEMGIDDATFNEALREMDADRSEGSWLWGGPTSTQIERTFDMTVDESSWPEIVGEIRASSGIIGEANSFGTSLQWSGGDPAFSVTVNSSEGKTKVSVMSKPTEYGLVMYLLGLVFVFTIAMVMAATWHLHFLGGLALFTLVLAAGWATVRAGYSAFCRSNQRRGERIMSRIQNHLMANGSVVQPLEARVSEPDPTQTVTS
jgi:hypothetical protein